MHREIQTRLAHNPAVLPLYSAFFISCLCQNVIPSTSSAVRVRATSSTSRPQTPIATSSTLVTEFQGQSTQSKVEELEKQLAERRTRLEQVQEQNAEYLRQVNQLLQEKFSEHCRCEQLQSQNTALIT